MTVYNPLDKDYKSMAGAVCERSAVKFRIKGCYPYAAMLIKEDGGKLRSFNMTQITKNVYECSISLDEGLYFYCFDVGDGLYISCGKNLIGMVSDSPIFYQLTVYNQDYTVPDWIKGGIIYQIFPDRFNRSEIPHVIPNGKVFHKDLHDTPIFLPDEKGRVLNNDFFGGNFKGITQKLEYLTKLGINAIYLNPVFKAYSNHRYDTADYLEFDDMLGNEDDFNELVEKAKSFGIKIILDGVFNHTGDDSIYFDRYGKYGGIGAYSCENSPYRNWFNFIDYPYLYKSWWGISTLPSTNKTDKSFIDFITGDRGVLRHYINMNIGGWRLDVVDELPSDFVKKIRRAIKDASPQAIIIGEVWEDATNKISYGERREYFRGKELDSAMNYPLKNAIINFVKNGDEQGLSQVINEQLDHYPHFALDCMMNILGTHDTARLLSAVGDFEPFGMDKMQLSTVNYKGEMLDKAILRLKAAVLLQYTLKGVPSVYYGDEAGMQGFADPLNRRFFPWDNINNEIHEWYVKLGKIRREFPLFKCGDCRVIYAKEGMIAFIRSDCDSQLLIACNLSPKKRVLHFEGKLTELISERLYSQKIELGAFDMGIYCV